MDSDCSYAVTNEICITNFIDYMKSRNLRFYPSFIWVVLNAINSQQEFRMGYDASGNLGYYDLVNAEYTVIKEGANVFDSLNTEYSDESGEFYASIISDITNYNERGILTNSRENSILISGVPWFSYAHLSFQMKSNLFFMRPMITWGRYLNKDGEIVLPFTIQVHHAVADSYHCHLLLEHINRILEQPEAFLL